MNIYIAVPVWGEHHVGLFLKYALPSLMTGGNLPFLASAGRANFEIFTDHASAQTMRFAPQIAKLERLMPVTYNFIETQRVNSKWSAVRESNRRMIKEADWREAVLFNFGPDCVSSNQCLQNAFRKIEGGYSVYMVPGYRSILEGMTEAVEEYRDRHNPDVIDLDAEKLIDLGHKLIHPEMLTWYWDHPTYASAATYISFAVGGQGTVAFCYNAHPIAVRVERRGTPLRWIFDQDYLGEACPDYSKHYIVSDAREAIFYEMSPEAQPFYKRQRKFLSKTMCTAMQREYWYVPARKYYPLRPVRLPYAMTDEAAWRATEKRGAGIIRRLEFLNSLPDVVLLFLSPEQLLMRSARRRRRDLKNDYAAWDRVLGVLAPVIRLVVLVVLPWRIVAFTRSMIARYHAVPVPLHRIARRLRSVWRRYVPAKDVAGRDRDGA
jgi:hypothetical protein